MNIKKIMDIAKEDQTPELKEKMYNMIRQFVYKYWRKYYPSFKGELDDLVSDFYTEFETAKSRKEGEEKTLLDRIDLDYTKGDRSADTTFAAVLKSAVTRMLIDRSRTDKHEINYSERYNEETGDLSLDFLAKHIDEPDMQVEDIEFSEDDIAELRDLYDNMTPEEQKSFLRTYKEQKAALSPNFQALFKDLTGI